MIIDFDKDDRDINISDPDAYIHFTPHNSSSKKYNYMLKSDFEKLKNGKIPEQHNFNNSYPYYSNTFGSYGGTATASYFFSCKEIVDLLLQDKDFIHKISQDPDVLLWFLPDSAKDLFVF